MMTYILFQNKKIFYREEGAGPSVILLHGFAEDGNLWSHQVKSLSENYYLIIPDLPGSGQSEMLEGKCTIEDYAEVVKAIADKAIFQNKKKNNLQFTLIGHSMGGYITLAFAQKYPELLNAFGLFHSSAFADDEAKIATRRKGIQFIEKNGSKAFLKTSVSNLFSENTQENRPQLITALLNIGEEILPQALIQYYEAMILRPDRTSVLKSFSKPVLFMIGKYDNAVPLNISLEQCHLPAISTIHILQNSGHMGMWEEEKLSSTYLKGFLDNV